jgi:N-acetyl-anhydromuramyl-L-alanine amidase AmpD
MKRIFFLLFMLLSVYTVFARQEKAAAEKVVQEAGRPDIVSRKKWNAKDPVGKVKEQTIRFITIHHTATPQKESVPIEKKLQNLQSFSQREDRLASGKLKPVWFDVPYHYYIAVDGKIAEGREIKFVGDTNTEYDPTGHALVVLEGNFQTEQPTSGQLESLKKLIAWLASRWKVPASEIKAHDDYAATACPGENLKKLLPALRQNLE